MSSRYGTELAGLPELSPGSHVDPSAGACFMEYASLLAGERWSDHPRCTHPALAQLARLVNDCSPREARSALVRMVPDVIGVNARDATATPALVLLCTRVMRNRGDGWYWRHHRNWALHRIARSRRGGLPGRWCAATDAIYRSGPALRVMERTALRLAAERSDSGEQLVDLLRAAIAGTRARLGMPVSVRVPRWQAA